MSGGVDSTVATYLLREQGYEVIGVSLKLWEGEDKTPTHKTCCSYQDVMDARSVCEKLGIPFYAFNYKKKFEEKVVQPFIEGYKQGITPNPCILCNQFVKFDLLLEHTKTLGADFLATGHYARIEKDDAGFFHLKKAVDETKDQSYVLYRLTQKDLAKILFPLGGYTKKQVREIAAKNNLPTATKHESQDICFIPKRDHAEFIEKYDQSFKPQAGFFVDAKGKVLGKHEGVHHYTVGQRRGLGIGFGERTYVIHINPNTAEVVLGAKEDLYSGHLRANDVNWVLPETCIQFPLESSVKVRYQKNDIPALIEPTGIEDEVAVKLSSHNSAISPGQSVVFYRGEEVLGGGWIQKNTEYLV